MTKLKRMLMMAGGTGGHVFPGLAVANDMRARGIEVHWLGTAQGLEARVVPEAHIPLHLVTIGGLRGKGIKTMLTAPFKIIRAALQSHRIMKAVNPDIVIGMGGFVSGPGGVASWFLGKPLIVHEQNAKAGMTNRLLSRLAKRVLEGFPQAFQAQSKAIMVGNPVRPEIENLPAPEQRFDLNRKRLRLLVIGGSLGAQALNEVVPNALAELPESLRPEVVHQTGDKHFDSAKKIYDSMEIDAKLEPFIKEMAQAYAWADLVVCRAGALTVAELCAAGLGAVFIPFPHAVDDHQTANAMFMVNQAAALCLPQQELSAKRLADILRQFAESPEKRLAMAQAAYRLRHLRVAETIFNICEEVCR